MEENMVLDVERGLPFGWVKVRKQWVSTNNPRRFPHVFALALDAVSSSGRRLTFGLCSRKLDQTVPTGGVFWLRAAAESIEPMKGWAYHTYGLPEKPLQDYVETLPTTARWTVSDPALGFVVDIDSDQLGLKIHPWLYRHQHTLVDVEKVFDDKLDPYKFNCRIRHIEGSAIIGMESGIMHIPSDELIAHFDRQWPGR